MDTTDPKPAILDYIVEHAMEDPSGRAALVTFVVSLEQTIADLHRACADGHLSETTTQVALNAVKADLDHFRRSVDKAGGLPR